MDATSLLAPTPLDSLRGQAQFDPIFRSGAKAESGSVLARALRREDGGVARLGMIVPKKKTKLAARRNAFKRVSREAFRALARADGRLAGMDVALQFKGLPADTSLADFKKRAAADVRAALALAIDAAHRPSPGRKPPPLR